MVPALLLLSACATPWGPGGSSAARGIPLWLACALQEAVQVDRQAEQDVEEVQQDEQRRLDRPSERLEAEEGGLAGRVALDWVGLRSWIEAQGIAVDLLLTHDLSWAAEGGREPDAAASRGLLELVFSFETRELLGWEGGLLYAGFELLRGENGSAEIGTLQELSSIDAEERGQLARVWLQQTLGPGFARVGKMDANSLFAYVDTGAPFLHSSMGVSPTVLGLPTYPDAAFGLALGGTLADALDLRLGVFDGAAQEGVPTGSRGPETLFGEPADLFLIAELGGHWGDARPGRVGLGAWRHTGTFERYDATQEDGTQGLYLVADQRLWREPLEDQRALGAFLQLGWADPEVSPFERHVGAGLVCTHPFARGWRDKLGLGVSSARLSGAPGAGFDARHETAVELFYGLEPVPWLRFKPALQYVLNPGGDADVDDAIVLTLRSTLSL